MCTNFSTQNYRRFRRFYLAAGLVLLSLVLMLPTAAKAADPCTIDNTYTADVVLFDTPMFFNRLGAHNPNWMMYALRRDVVPIEVGNIIDLIPGASGKQRRNVQLRPDKRPRPLVLRVPADSCLEIDFQNLLSPNDNPLPKLQPPAFNDNQVAGRYAGVHIAGMQLVSSSTGEAIDADGSNVGAQGVTGSAATKGGLVAPGETITYKVYAEREGAFLLTSGGATFGGEATGGNVGVGAFGMVAVQPKDAVIYRSQVTEEEMRLATSNGSIDYEATYPAGEFLVDPNNEKQTITNNATGGTFTLTFGVDTNGSPVSTGPIDYNAPANSVQAALVGLSTIGDNDVIVSGDSQNWTVEFTGDLANQEVDLLVAVDSFNELKVTTIVELLAGSAGTPNVWFAEGKAGKPILNMMDGHTIFHSEINAIVAYKDGSGNFTNFPASTYPLESQGKQNPTVPNRLEPFRDFASVWHDENAAVQAFPDLFDDPTLTHTLHGVRDSFMINYGSGGIGSEIIANRTGVGPMYDCLDCAYEEFFLTSFTVGDPAMRVDIPANMSAGGPIATEALYPEDPANVHHSYTGDKVKLRNVHAGPKEQHIFHLHNHQWLFNANDDNSNYLDAQGVGPGSGYTYEINYGGSGNRNKTSGDAIFHCHFYPHFAQGMWYLWRNHDVLETGTVLAVSGGTVAEPNYHVGQWDLQSGKPAAGARALPDGEIIAGTPIPAVVPLPGKPLPPVPATVRVVAKDANGDGLADSSQADVDRLSALGPDGDPGTPDDKNPGFPFWVAGIDCGGAVDDLPGGLSSCESGIVGQRPPTPQLDMLPNDKVEDLLADDPFYSTHMPAIIRAEGGDVAKWQASFTAGAGGFDGGLPRHALDGCKAADPIGTAGNPNASCASTAGTTHVSSETRLDFHKEVLKAKFVLFPEAGTDLEKVAMGAHAVRTDANGFVLNGGPPVPGAPYNEPCIDDKGAVFYNGVNGNFFDGNGGTGNLGTPEFGADNPRKYRAANIQIDAVFNKVGYHYPQQRIIALWGDVKDTINKTKAPEPFVMRLNTFDCAQYYHSNLVPKEFEVDDYQVRTPTDIIGQHIHLPKWDLTTADGAANGWNYEDGTLSPGMVVERIEAINHFTGAAKGDDNFLEPEDHPYPVLAEMSQVNGNEWLGARVTTQRWFTDPVYNTGGVDRGLGIVFTHDHYGPSSFQQIGLYATLLVEPAGSTWKHNETGVVLGGQTPADPDGPRDDGGPTSWQAIITPGDVPANAGNTEPFREFYFEFSDFQHAYEAGVYVGAGPDGRPFTATTSGHKLDGRNKAFPVTANSFRNAINPSYREQAGPILPDIVRFPPLCKDGSPRPCPEAISADDPGMLVVNYRNEPVGLRVFDPDKEGPDTRLGSQADGLPGDLAFALQSREDRAIAQLNVQPGEGDIASPAIPIYDDPFDTNSDTTYPPPINVGGVEAGDPFTPMLRAYAGDLVKIKIQAGATEHEHSTTIHGVKWLQGGSGHGQAPNSGWRNAQNSGISEQFTFRTPVTPLATAVQPQQIDYAYMMDASQDGLWSGMWGLMRNYSQTQGDLPELDGNPMPMNVGGDVFPNSGTSPIRSYDLTAVLANDVLGNSVGATIPPNTAPAADNVGGPLDPNGGTLVYNPRGGTSESGDAQFNGPLHDPTAILYVHSDDLVAVDPTDPRCLKADDVTVDSKLPTCPVKLADGVPVEPIVLRAAAGESLRVRLRNKLLEQAVTGVGAEIVAGHPVGDPVFSCTPVVDAPNTCDSATLAPVFTLENAQDKLAKGLLLVQGDATTPVEIDDIIFDQMPDLAGYNTLLQMVIRDRDIPMQGQKSVTTFNNNLIRPSYYVGLHPQLVAYDVTRNDGTVVGINPVKTQGIVAPGQNHVYEWYAGHLDTVPGRGRGNNVNLVHTPVEFGGSNLIPADKIKQGQKGAVGALIIEPEGYAWTEDATMRAAADVGPDAKGGGGRGKDPDGIPDSVEFRDFAVVVQKGLNLRYGDGSPVENIAGEGGAIPEDSHDAGQKGINYGTEPAWFRFGVGANTPFGTLANEPNPEEMYANALAGGDPATPVYEVTAGQEARMRVLEPTGVGRGTTFTVHGHIWQRDPYLEGAVPSQTIGDNWLGMWLNGQESVTPAQHFDVRLEEAGGKSHVAGDYLYRDQASFGNTDGIWGLMRVVEPDSGGAPGGGGGGKGGGKKNK